MAASASDKFMKVAIATATTLDAPGYTIGNTSITVASTSTWPTDTGVTFAIDEVDANGDRVANSYNEYVGTVASGTSVTSVSHVNGTDRDYSAGATTRVYIPVSEERENRLVEGILADHSQSGGHEFTTVYDPSNPTLETLKLAGVSSAVNELTVTNAATGNPAKLSATGGDTNIGLDYQTKGSGAHTLKDGNGNEVVKTAAGTASAVNEVTFTNAATGNAPTIAATGDDTNIPLKLSGKGTGAIQLFVNGVDQLGAWQSWTPSWTNLTVGDGTVVAKYIQIGKTVFFDAAITFGSTTSVTGSGVRLSLPLTSVNYTTAFSRNLGDANFWDTSGSSIAAGFCSWVSTTLVEAVIFNASSTYVVNTAVSSTAPFTWATGDVLSIHGFYEVA